MRCVSVTQRPGYASGSTVTLDVPDLSGVNGFDVTWGRHAGTPGTWTATGIGWTLANSSLGAPWSDDAGYLHATQAGTFTP
jgi:hypothetical protein